MPPGDHFTFPYKFAYNVPEAYKDKFAEFIDEDKKLVKQWRKERREGKDAGDLTEREVDLFEKMFKMAPEKLATLLVINVGDDRKLEVIPLN